MLRRALLLAILSLACACRREDDPPPAAPAQAGPWIAPQNAVMGRLNTAMDAETFASAAEAQRPLVETDETKKGGLGVMTEARWATLGTQLAELGVVPKAPPAAECFKLVVP